MRSKFAALLLAACLFSPAIHAEESAPAEYLYTVKPGDNLSTFARDMLDSIKRWPEVARYNKLKNPQIIMPGQVLRIQLPWMKNMPVEARIEALNGAATLNGFAAKVGDKVAAGARLETSAGANMRMSLPDGSMLSLAEKTRLEAARLDKKPQGEFFYALFRLVTGRIDALKKKYPEGQAPLRIEAMHGTIGVRGTHFRMGQEDGNTLAEIENGLVSFGDEAIGKPIALAGGQGSVADGVHAPGVIDLLPAPIFPVLPDAFAPDAVSFVMPPMADARAYRGELALDEDFKQIIAPVSASGSAISIPGLSEGIYWLRLRAVDGHGLQGMQAQTLLHVKAAPVVIAPPPPADFPVVEPHKPITNGMQILTRWQEVRGFQYQVQIASTADFVQPLQDVRSSVNYLNLPTPPKGEYFIRMRLLDAANRVGHWSEPVAFTTE